jgi:hypothetical protein
MRSSLYFSSIGSRSWKTVNEPVSRMEAIQIYLKILSGVTFLMLTYYYWFAPALFPHVLP